MDNRSTLAALGGLGALVAAFGFSMRTDSRPPVSRPPSESIVAVRRGATVYMDGIDDAIARYTRGQELLAEYFGVAPGDFIAAVERATTPDTGKSATSDKGRHVLDLPARRLRVLIATVPDPEDSHLDWSYDAYLESMQRAFSAAGFVPDRFWLPAREDSVKLTTGSRDTTTHALHDVRPGVMLLRSTSTSDLALLYLVYELPTSGVHKWAFAAAVHERSRLLRSRFFETSDPDRDSLEVIGPSFSGSATSLRSALDNAFARDPALRAHVVTGAATSLDSAQLGPKVNFRATVQSDAALNSGAAFLLDRLAIPDGKVAVLTESATQYGQARDKDEAHTPLAVKQNSAAPSTNANAHYLRFVFPLNVASLRSAVTRTQASDAPRDLLDFEQSARPELSLAEQARARESPPVAAPGVTIPSLDLALRELTGALSRHGIKAVLIRATDIRDKLMLAELLKRRLRNVQLVVFGSHVLLSRPEYSTYLRGAYVIGSYPMSLENQWWSPTRDDSRISFPNDASIGVYNATLSVLGRQEMRMEYTHVKANGDTALGPPVWISLVGRTGLVPLVAVRPPGHLNARVDTSRNPRETKPDSLVKHQGHTGPLSRLVTLAGLSALIILLLNQLEIHRRMRGELMRRWRKRRVSSQRPPKTSEVLLTVLSLLVRDPRNSLEWYLLEPSPITQLSHARERVFSLTLLSSLTALALCISAPPLLAGHSDAGFLDSVIAWAMFLVSGVLTVKTTFGLLRMGQYAANFPTRKEGMALGLVAANAAFTSLALLVFAVLAYLATDGNTGSAAAFALRVSLPASGVSPFLPLTLLAISCATWSWWQWKQVRSVETQRTPFEWALIDARKSSQRANDTLAAAPNAAPASEPQADPSAWGLIARMIRADERLTDAFARFLPPKRPWVPALLVLVAVTAEVMLYERPPEAVALARFPAWGTSYDLLMLVAPLSLIGSILWATLRLYFGWSAVDELSVAITEWPLNNAFARLPKGVSNLTSVGLIGTSDSLREQNAAEELGSKMLDKLHELNYRSPASSSLTSLIPLAAALPSAATSGSFNRNRQKRTSLLMSAMLKAWRDAGTRPRDEGDAPWGERPLSRATQAALRSIEEYMAFEAVVYVESILANIRRLALFLLVSLIAAVALVGSYPVQPASLLKSAIVVLLLFAVIILFVVMTGMSRNPLLSRLAGTVPGKVTWDTTFMLNIVLFAILPLLILSSSEFPTVRNMLFSWTEPALRSVGRF